MIFIVFCTCNCDGQPPRTQAQATLSRRQPQIEATPPGAVPLQNKSTSSYVSFDGGNDIFEPEQISIYTEINQYFIINVKLRFFKMMGIFKSNVLN